MDDSRFKLNPVVTLGHRYYSAPVGMSVWRKKTANQNIRGIKAKTFYPSVPNTWPKGEIWPPDKVWGLVQSGLVKGKSIGFVPIEHNMPTSDELRAHPEWREARRIIRKWLLVEYAVATWPVNPDAVVTAVGKGEIDLPEIIAKDMGIELPKLRPVFVDTLAHRDRIAGKVAKIDPADLAKRAIQGAFNKRLGKV